MNEDDRTAAHPSVAAVTDDATSDEGGAEGAVAAAPGAAHVDGACPVAWCPFCLAVGAVQPLRPEVVDHLLKAGTELLLAFRGVLDARADEVAGNGPATSPTKLEKIDLG